MKRAIFLQPFISLKMVLKPEYASASRFSMNAVGQGVFLTPAFREAAETAINDGQIEFDFTEEDGTQATYYIEQQDWTVDDRKT